MASKDLHGCVWILIKGIIARLSQCHRAMWPPGLIIFWGGSGIFLLYVSSLQFPLWQTHFLVTFSSVTSKISWTVGWLWLNYVYTFISRHTCISVIDSIDWYMIHKKTPIFVSILCLEILDFGMEKSWNFFLRFLWEPTIVWSPWHPLLLIVM